jgi:hypothetical protein
MRVHVSMCVCMHSCRRNVSFRPCLAARIFNIVVLDIMITTTRAISRDIKGDESAQAAAHMTGVWKAHNGRNTY